MKLGIGVVITPRYCVPAEFWGEFDKMCSEIRTGASGVWQVERFWKTSQPGVDVSRNRICREALADGCDELLFVDADHLVPADLHERLHTHDKPVITARYHTKAPPFHANAYVKHPLAPNENTFKTVHYGQGCFEIDRGGAGALLIKREVLEAIGKDTDEWFRYQRNPNPGEPKDFSVSEDFWFYQRAQECGFSCWCDWETEVPHIAEVAITKAHNDVYLDLMEKGLTRKTADGLVACGFDEPITRGGFVIQPHVPPVAVG